MIGSRIIKLKKLIGLVFIIVFHVNVLFAQRLSFGINYQMTALHYTHFNKDIYFSPSSFKGFYLAKNQFNFTGACMSVGFVSVMDISRFSIWLEWGIFNDTEGQLTKLDYPYSDGSYQTYYSRINNGGSRILTDFQYILFPAMSMKPFVGLGFANVSPMQATEDISTQRDFKKGWYNEYEMLPVFHFSQNYNSYLLESGVKNSNFSFSVRYYFKWNKNTAISNYYSFITLSLSTITNFSGLKRQVLYFE